MVKEKNWLFQVSCKNKQEAQKIGKILLNEKLIACANIIPKMESMYWWSEKIEQSTESLLVGKTTKKLSKKVEKRIQELHSYNSPCIEFIEIQTNAKCANWISQVTQK
ncbi:MAG: divalent-cation tolerance protein CutA [Candidatus Diapherotrites archaeon]|nr:divalent-cation tolerance protein CutA [Candidatus Diapherotrites archaeon]